MSLIPISGDGPVAILLSRIASNPGLLIMLTTTGVGIATSFVANSIGFSTTANAIMTLAGTGIAVLSVFEITNNILPKISEVLAQEIQISTLEQVNELAESIEVLSFVYVAGLASVMVVYYFIK